MVVTVNDPMNAGGNSQSFDVSPKAGGEILTETGLLCLVKQKTRVQILERIF